MYTATFFTQYGAQVFYKRIKKTDETAKLMPVPRVLSAACGICVAFEGDITEEIVLTVPEDMEALYEYNESGYIKLFEYED